MNTSCTSSNTNQMKKYVDKSNFRFILCAEALKELNRPIGVSYDEIKYLLSNIGFHLKDSHINTALIKGITGDIFHTKSGRFYLNEHSYRVFKLKTKGEKETKSIRRSKQSKLNRRWRNWQDLMNIAEIKSPQLKLDTNSCIGIMMEPTEDNSGHCKMEMVPPLDVTLPCDCNNHLETESNNDMKVDEDVNYLIGNNSVNIAATPSASSKETALSFPAFYNHVDETKQVNVSNYRKRKSLNTDENNNVKFKKIRTDMIEKYLKANLQEFLPNNYKTQSNVYNDKQLEPMQTNDDVRNLTANRIMPNRENIRNNFTARCDNNIVNSDSHDVNNEYFNFLAGSKRKKLNNCDLSFVSSVNSLNHLVYNQVESNKRNYKDKGMSNQEALSLSENSKIQTNQQNNKSQQTRKVLILNEKLNNYQPYQPLKYANEHRINFPKSRIKRYAPIVSYDSVDEHDVKEVYHRNIKKSFSKYIKIKSKCLKMSENRDKNIITIYCEYCKNKKKRKYRKYRKRRKNNRNKILQSDRNDGQNLINTNVDYVQNNYENNVPKMGFALWRYFNPNQPYYAHTVCS